MSGLAPWKLMRVGAALLAGALTLSAEPRDVRARTAPQQDDTPIRMAALLDYSGIVNPAPDDVSRLAELWTRAQQPGLAQDERRRAFRDLYLHWARLHGRDLTARPQALDGLAGFATIVFEGGGRMDLALPEPCGKPAGSYLHVETRGSGQTPLLLISDLGVDGRQLYDSFAERQGRCYTMHIVTLPWAGAARPLPWPEKLDYAARPWLSQIESELLALVDQPRMKGVTVIGTSAGGYFAARLALLRPRRVRAVVLVNSLVASTMRDEGNPDAPAPLAQRLARVRSIAPSPQLFPVAPVPPPEELRRRIADPSSTHPTARNWMAFAVKDPAVSRGWTFEALSRGFLVPSLEYAWELTSTDLGAQMKELAVPLLAMGSWHDQGSTAVNLPTLSGWEEMKLLYPAIPLTVVAFDDTRAYVSADAPAEFDRALADFLAGRPVHGETGYHLPRISPRASIMQAVGEAEIAISYGRPAVKERKVWGAMVPSGRVWRAGANEATRFTCNRELKIEGHPLAAGAYTFFVVPGETEWTVIFNRVPRQWGAFDYNPAFDALRFSVKPAEAPHQEVLRYAIEPTGPSAAVATLVWEQRAISFRIEVATPPTPG
jgi:pimeloyl-ACP methyl ester carboxylesterase